MATSRLTRKGQTTIPGAIRKHLKLTPGDRMDLVVQGDGSVRLEAATVDIRELKGLLAPARRRATTEPMRATIRRRAR